MIDELELVGCFGKVDPLSPEALEKAEATLRIAIVAEIDSAETQTVRRSHRRRPRRRTVTCIVATAAVVIATACGALLVSRSGPPHIGHIATGNQSRIGASQPTIAAPTAAVLVAKVDAALSGVSGDISFSHQVGTDGWITDSWLSPDDTTTRITNYDHGIKNTDLTYMVAHGRSSATVVDYPDHAWWSYSNPLPLSSSPGCKLPYCGDAANGGMAPGPTNGDVPVSVAGVKWLVNNAVGRFTLVKGTKFINGVETYEITRSLVGHATRSIWISRTTNLPIREATKGTHEGDETSEYSWLPPTRANVAALQVPVPSNFAHSAHPLSP